MVLALSWHVAPRAAEKRRPYDRIVVFGTSISDSGNVFELTGGHNTPPAYDLDELRGRRGAVRSDAWVRQLAGAGGLLSERLRRRRADHALVDIRRFVHQAAQP